MLSGIIFLGTSLAFGQYGGNPQKNKSKQHSSTNQQQLSGTKAVVGSGNSINDAGSPAQVRSERIGSLCPGNVSNVGPDRYKPENSAPSSGTKPPKQ